MNRIYIRTAYSTAGMKLREILCYNSNGNMADLTSFRVQETKHFLRETKENHENFQLMPNTTMPRDIYK
jgi:hypothetical protein